MKNISYKSCMAWKRLNNIDINLKKNNFFKINVIILTLKKLFFCNRWSEILGNANTDGTVTFKFYNLMKKSFIIVF